MFRSHAQRSRHPMHAHYHGMHYGRFRGPLHGPLHHHADLDGLTPAEAKAVLRLAETHAKQRLLTLELQHARRAAHGSDSDQAEHEQAVVLDKLQKLTLRQADLANRVNDLRLHRAAHLQGPKPGHKPHRCPRGAFGRGGGRGGHRHHHRQHGGRGCGLGLGWKAQPAALLQALPDNAKVVLIDGRFLERVGLDQPTIDAFFTTLPTDHGVVHPGQPDQDQEQNQNQGQGAAEAKGKAEDDPTTKGKACVGARILTRVAEALAADGDGPVVVVSARPHLLRKAQASGAAVMGPQVFKQLVDPNTTNTNTSTAGAGSSSLCEESEALDAALEQVHLDNDERGFGDASVEHQHIAMALAQIHDLEPGQAAS